MGDQCGTKIIEDGAILQTQSLNRSHNALGEPAAVCAVISKTAFAPEHSRTHHPFGMVVGRLNAFHFSECPQRVVNFQQPLAEAFVFFVFTLASAPD